MSAKRSYPLGGAASPVRWPQGRLLQEPEGVGGAPPEGRGVCLEGRMTGLQISFSLYHQALTGSVRFLCVSGVL